jgi:hypothetical protein
MSDGSQAVRPHRGPLILVLGILGVVLCQICGIVAWVMGNSDLEAMDRGEMDRAGEGMTKAGKILGIVSVALMAVGVLIGILFVVGAVAVGVQGR